jgi:hypothetical protein
MTFVGIIGELVLYRTSCFRLLGIRNLSDGFLPIRTLLKVSHNSISADSFLGIPDSVRIYNTSLLTES